MKIYYHYNLSTDSTTGTQYILNKRLWRIHDDDEDYIDGTSYHLTMSQSKTQRYHNLFLEELLTLEELESISSK